MNVRTTQVQAVVQRLVMEHGEYAPLELLLATNRLERLIEAPDFPDWALRTAWRVAAESGIGGEMTPAWFPAWMLIEEPGLAGVLAPRRTGDDPSRAFDAVMELLAHPAPDERGIELRRSLQAIHPGLLQRFLARRAQAAPHPQGPLSRIGTPA